MLRLDGRAVGHEAIAYSSDSHVPEICVDAGSIAHADRTQWLCFGTSTRVGALP